MRPANPPFPCPRKDSVDGRLGEGKNVCHELLEFISDQDMGHLDRSV
jgi:hypothetical protein